MQRSRIFRTSIRRTSFMLMWLKRRVAAGSDPFDSWSSCFVSRLVLGRPLMVGVASICIGLFIDELLRCKFLRSISKLMSETRSLNLDWGKEDNFCLAWFLFRVECQLRKQIGFRPTFIDSTFQLVVNISTQFFELGWWQLQSFLWLSVLLKSLTWTENELVSSEISRNCLEHFVVKQQILIRHIGKRLSESLWM